MVKYETTWKTLAKALGVDENDSRGFDYLIEEVKDLVALRDAGSPDHALEFRKARLALAFELGFGHQDIGMEMILHKVKELADAHRNRGAFITVDDNIKVGESWSIGLEHILAHKPWFPGYPTEAARVIFEELIPKWTAEFLKKNAHYADTYKNLGVAGQYADIWRKVGPLKKLLWDSKNTVQFDDAESAEDICNDLIGHLFLTLAMLKEGKDNVE